MILYGRSTATVLAAPRNAVYLVASIDWVKPFKKLARELRREDLQIRPMAELLDRGEWQGKRIDNMVLDHRARRACSQKQFDSYQRYLKRNKNYE